VFPRDNI